MVCFDINKNYVRHNKARSKINILSLFNNNLLPIKRQHLITALEVGMLKHQQCLYTVYSIHYTITYLYYKYTVYGIICVYQTRQTFSHDSSFTSFPQRNTCNNPIKTSKRLRNFTYFGGSTTKTHLILKCKTVNKH